MQIFCHLLRKAYPFGLRSLGDFISRRIHDHTGMVEIFPDHIFEILFPPVIKVIDIIILCLMDVPYIHKLIHHEHSQPVARLKQRLGTRIVSRTDGIVSVFFEDTDLPLLGLRIAACPEHAVIMVDTCAPQDDTLPVHRETFLCVPPDRADTECDLLLIGLRYVFWCIRGEFSLQPVQIRCIHSPQAGFRHRHPYCNCSVCVFPYSRHNFSCTALFVSILPRFLSFFSRNDPEIESTRTCGPDLCLYHSR